MARRSLQCCKPGTSFPYIIIALPLILPMGWLPELPRKETS